MIDRRLKRIDNFCSVPFPRRDRDRLDTIGVGISIESRQAGSTNSHLSTADGYHDLALVPAGVSSAEVHGLRLAEFLAAMTEHT
jgi:hypothetical protein